MVCPSCGMQVPDNEYMCPNCSASLTAANANPFYEYNPRDKKRKNKTAVWTVLIALVFFFGLASVGFYFLGGENLTSFFGRDSASKAFVPPNMAANSGDLTVTITFREGLRLLQTADLLEENGVCAAEAFVEATQSMDITGYSFAEDIEANVNQRYYRLEGYLFPDTYEFYRNEDPELVAERMLQNFEDRMTDDLRARAAEIDMTVDQVVALASIITKEAGKSEDMPLVSSVFHNRLKDEYGKLESDPTYYYPYASREDVPTELLDTFESRYNTYKIQGLPPGAICNPGLDAIQAALNPANTDYYFFVYDIFGQYYFAVTWEEHKQNVALIQKIKAEASGQEEEQIGSE